MNLTVSTTATPRLNQLYAKLGDTGRTELARAMGHEVQRLTGDYLTSLAATRHDTAAKLGASPSNHLAQAAEKAASPSALSIDAATATLTINHPGMVRALRDVTIVPRDAKCLAIPVAAIAYNRRPAQLWETLHLFIPKGKNVICMESGNKITVLYVLVRKVTQKQDRTLLPADEDLQSAARLGAANFINSL